jgi:uncharacterized protein YaaQ
MLLTLVLGALLGFSAWAHFADVSSGTVVGLQNPVAGVLSTEAPVRPKEGSHYVAYSVTLPAGGTYVFTLRSGDFNPVIVLRDARGFELATGHDAPGLGRAAQVHRSVDEEQEFEVLVTSEAPEAIGRYLLTMHRVRAPALMVGEPVQGELDETDTRYYEDDTFVDRFHLQVRAGEAYIITLRGEGFRPVVFVESDDRRRLTVSERTVGENESRTVFDALQDGVVYVVANGMEVEDQGSYTLSAESDEGGDVMLQTAGLLAEGDAQARDESFYDSYPLEVVAGGTYVVTMESEDFDTFLLLVDGDERRIAANDDASGTNSRLVFHAPRTERLEVWANSYQAGMTGQYHLEVRGISRRPAAEE